MITGIIWKVEALPTPVAKNSAMKQAKKPQKLRPAVRWQEVDHAERPPTIIADEGPEGDPPAAELVGDPAGRRRG